MRVGHRAAVVGVVVAICAAWSPAANANPRETAPPGQGHDISHVSMPTHGHSGDGVPGAAKTPAAKRTSSNGISYHGGPVMYSGVHVYLIWYGNWAGDTADAILPNLVTGLSGSQYYNINTTYYDSANRKV